MAATAATETELRPPAVELPTPAALLEELSGSAQEWSRHGRDYRLRRLLVASDVCALAIGMATWALLNASHPGAHVLWAC